MEIHLARPLPPRLWVRVEVNNFLLRQMTLSLAMVLAISACEKGYEATMVVALKSLVRRCLVEELTVFVVSPLQFRFEMKPPDLSRHPPTNRYCGGVPTQRATATVRAISACEKGQ